MAMIAHLAGILSFIGPLIVWAMKKDQDSFVAEHARESLNFNITVAIAMIGAFILSWLPIIGLLAGLVMVVVGIGWLVFTILAAIAANNGQSYRYPVSLRLVN